MISTREFKDVANVYSILTVLHNQFQQDSVAGVHRLQTLFLGNRGT